MEAEGWRDANQQRHKDEQAAWRDGYGKARMSRSGRDEDEQTLEGQEEWAWNKYK